MSKWLLHEVLIPFAKEFSYVGIALAILATGIGLPCPEDILLLLGGYLVHRHEGSLALMVIVSLASVLAGDLIMFGLGRRYGRKILHWWLIRKLLPPERVVRIEGFYLKHGKKTIFFGRFAAGLRPGIFLLAGTLQMSVVRFVVMDLLAALLSVPALVWLGRKLGKRFEEQIDEVVDELAAIKLTVLLVLALVALCYVWWRHRKSMAAARAGANCP